MRHPLATLALVTSLPVAAAAQTLPVRTLTKPTAEWSEPFSQITGVRELKNGRVIITDSRDKVVQLIDFAGEAKKIGREGAGPAEYGLPQSVFAAPGDTTWVYDVLNSRYLVIDPTGKPVSTFMIADANAAFQQGPIRSGGAARGGLGFGFAQGIDGMGRLYFRVPTVRVNDEGPVAVDSTPVVRWDRKTDRVDTVGVLVNPRVPTSTTPLSGGGGGGGDNVRVSVRMGGATPFGSADTYVVTPGGDVAVIRARDYHVDWIVKGKTVAGAPIRFDRVKVTEADKKAWIDSRKNATATMIVNDGSGRRVQNVPAPADAAEFPEFKGPFINAAAAPNGQVWVQKHMPADSPPTYDVIDNTGKVVSRVVLPKRTRLLGFGTGTVYLARSDEDDLQYLQRYAW